MSLNSRQEAATAGSTIIQVALVILGIWTGILLALTVQRADAIQNAVTESFIIAGLSGLKVSPSSNSTQPVGATIAGFISTGHNAALLIWEGLLLLVVLLVVFVALAVKFGTKTRIRHPSAWLLALSFAWWLLVPVIPFLLDLGAAGSYPNLNFPSNFPTSEAVDLTIRIAFLEKSIPFAQTFFRGIFPGIQVTLLWLSASGLAIKEYTRKDRVILFAVPLALLPISLFLQAIGNAVSWSIVTVSYSTVQLGDVDRLIQLTSSWLLPASLIVWAAAVSLFVYSERRNLWLKGQSD